MYETVCNEDYNCPTHVAIDCENGCSDGRCLEVLDEDEDGVLDEDDECSGTASGVVVDVDGELAGCVHPLEIINPKIIIPTMTAHPFICENNRESFDKGSY